MSELPDPRLCIAPMMEWTDRHCRVFHRLLAPRTLLYTEMVTTGAILHGDRDRHLAFDLSEHPLALQLGGSEPNDLARSVEIAAQYGYDEINLNVGCPSARVQSGAFGACLMAEPELVRDCCAAMIKASSIPVTVKTRIGIDDSEDYTFLETFVDTVREAGVSRFIIHARKAWLKGLSPKQNREVPPLRYKQVYELKATRPDLEIIINGGITTTQQVREHLEFVDGVMIGRQAYQNPACLPEMEFAAFGKPNLSGAFEVLAKMRPYIDRQIKNGTPFRAIARHMLGLFNGKPGARQYRRTLCENMGRADAGPWLFDMATEPLVRLAA